MSIATVHINDIGTVLELTITENGEPMDLSTATVKWIKFQRKDRSTYAVNADFVTDGTDGLLKHTFGVGELNVRGEWTAQGYVVMPNGSWHTSKTTFAVEDNIAVAPEDEPV